MKVADSGQGESLEFALSHLPKERFEIVEQTAKEVHTVSKGITRRGKKALAAMSDSEWDELVRKANE